MGAGITLLPAITISSTTNFNESRATFNAVVNPNGYTTSVQFQYKKSSESTWTNGSTVTGIIGSVDQNVFSNQTGLEINNSTGTIYNVRAVATNAIGTQTSGTTTFTTWRLKTYTKTLAGSDTVLIPSITPTGGSLVSTTVYDIFVCGGGGGAGLGGGGAGGRRTLSFVTFTGSNRTLSITVGDGGAARSTGGSSSITGTDWPSVSAGGGQGGAYNPPYGGSGGNGGTGDTTNSGGVGYTNVDKNGNPDGLYYSYGGGAGWSANGGSGGDILDGPYRPGNGGNGATSLYGAFAGGAGGRGYSLQAGAGAVGTNGLEWGGHGSGGQAVDGAGVRGVVYFRYYGE
jgi:hypothetical protein